MRPRNSGERVEVQGGHTMRSIGKKDRHSKVCTAKGLRDRRVRLSALTAIQFYDVQDRLGYDRPSKAVDWLIMKAKDAISQLTKLPAQKPTINLEQNQEKPHSQHGSQLNPDSIVEDENKDQELHIKVNNSILLPPLDSDCVADTIKSFFPTGASSGGNSSAMQFQSFSQPDLLPKSSSQMQDLRLSLQSFQDPNLLHHRCSHQAHQNRNYPIHQNDQDNIFPGPTHLEFNRVDPDWSDNQSMFQRMLAWNGGQGCGETSAVSTPGVTAVGSGFMLNVPTQTRPFLHLPSLQAQLFSQGGPLQSSYTPAVHAWIDLMPAFSAAGIDHQQSHTLSFHPFAMAGGLGFASVAGLPEFQIPARIQGEAEVHDGFSDMPSSASSDSRH